MTTICKVLLLIIANLFACWILLAAARPHDTDDTDDDTTDNQPTDNPE